MSEQGCGSVAFIEMGGEESRKYLMFVCGRHMTSPGRCHTGQSTLSELFVYSAFSLLLHLFSSPPSLLAALSPKVEQSSLGPEK